MSGLSRVCHCGNAKPPAFDECYVCRNPPDPQIVLLQEDAAKASAENRRLRSLLHAVVIHLEESIPRARRTELLQDLLDRANHPLGRRGL